MTIVVTGSAGHLGDALMRTLRTRGGDPVGMDVKPSPTTDAVGSVTDREFVRRTLRGAHAVVHAATLHKPHVSTHRAQDFIDTNVTGTLVLLEEAFAAGVGTFVFTSTTSAFGAALKSEPGGPATWITEEAAPSLKNIYGATKLAAEHLCEMFARKGLPTIILRTSRFFPEEDDDAEIRAGYGLDNAQANELLYRRVDIEDAVEAHLCALSAAKNVRFGKYIISATTPFAFSDLEQLGTDPGAVLSRYFEDWSALYAERGWRMFPRIDRVYVNARAREVLGWRPRYDFAHAMASLRAGRNFRSDLARAVGSKGYHATRFSEGPYPVASTD